MRHSRGRTVRVVRHEDLHDGKRIYWCPDGHGQTTEKASRKVAVKFHCRECLERPARGGVRAPEPSAARTFFENPHRHAPVTLETPAADGRVIESIVGQKGARCHCGGMFRGPRSRHSPTGCHEDGPAVEVNISPDQGLARKSAHLLPLAASRTALPEPRAAVSRIDDLEARLALLERAIRRDPWRQLGSGEFATSRSGASRIAVLVQDARAYRAMAPLLVALRDLEQGKEAEGILVSRVLAAARAAGVLS